VTIVVLMLAWRIGCGLLVLSVSLFSTTSVKLTVLAGS